jgi:RNA polymerase sigma factor (sigma-70 family)
VYSLFEEIYARYHNTVYKYVLVSLGFDAGLADDCMQDIYVLLLEKKDRVEKHPNPGGFFIVTARNYIMKYRTALQERTGRQVAYDDRVIPAREDLPDDDTDYDLIKDGLLAKLTYNERKLYGLFYERGLSAAEAAKYLGITEGNVKVRLFRLRVNVKKLVREIYA